MLTLNDGRAELWQWDTGRTLAVDADCSQVHFSNKVFGRSIDVDVVDGVAIIPDILLQTDKDLNVWAFVGTAENGYTKISKTFKVNRRSKPADYVFTQTDQMTLQTIQRQIGDLADLTTEAKDTLVAAINEAARTGGSGGGGTPSDVKMKVSGGYIQYSTDGGTTWRNLIAVAELIGAPGKSAYDYAEEAGYTGTETEFAARLAAEIPTVDSTLTKIGQAADAAVVGNRLSTLSEEKVGKAGWTPDKYIGTDAGGNLIEKDTPAGGGSGTVTSVNGVSPDENGNVTVEVGQPTDDQVATAVEGWLDKHPEATTTVADRSITREKMAFPAYEGALSPNLADPSAYTIARFTSTSGGKQPFGETSAYADYWRMTDYIDVSNHIGEQLWATNWQGYCFYAADKTAISESGKFISNISMDLSKYSTEPITIPDGAAYIVLAFLYARGTVNLMLNFGDALLPYIQYGDINLPDASVGDAQINGKLSLDKVDTAKLLLPTVGKNLVDKSQMVKDKAVYNTGAIVDMAASLNRYYVGDIRVIGGADYLVYANNVVFFDTYGNVCGSDGNNDTFAYRKIKAPISAVSCVVNSSQYEDCPAHMIHGAFMVEGSVLPTRVVCEKNYGEKAIDPNIIGKSVLHRMADCWNPSTKTTIGLCGDSNTRGIMGNGDTTQNPSCWANLVTAEIVNKCSGERRIYPYGDIGVWGCTSYNNREPQIRNAGVIKIPFYGTSIGLVWGSGAGAVDFNVTIDDGETIVTSVPDTGYTWDGLTEGYHTINLEWAAAGTYTISHFVVNKTIEVINRGISGHSFEHLNADLSVTGDTIDIICYGTNNRESGNINSEASREIDYFEYCNRDTGLIYMSPIPALDSIEEVNEAWKTIPYIESFIAGREARNDRDYISLYREIKDYCTMHNVELTSLYVDGLHLNDSGHRIVAQILCRKLGLGDLSE